MAADGDAAAAAAAAGAAAAKAAVGGRKGGAGLGKAGGDGGLELPQQAEQEADMNRFARADLGDVEGATLMSWQFLATQPLLLKGAEARQALKDWVELLGDAHPVER